MSAGSIVFGLVFGLLGLILVALVAVGLPGTWLLIGTAALVELLDGLVLGSGDAGAVVTFGWPLLLGTTGLAAFGEVLEFFSGAAGARFGGGTRRGFWGALIGGIAGAVLLTVGLPIPVVGALIGALVGTFVGAWLGEATSPRPRSREETIRAAGAAVAGHVGGLLGKLGVGILVWILLVRAAVLS